MFTTLKKLISVVLGTVILLLAGCSSVPKTSHIPAVICFDVAKYMGKWHEIARLPHRFERGLTDCVAEYTLRDDGKVSVVNSGLKDGVAKTATAVAVFKGDSTIGELKVSFFRPFYGSYRIIHLEPDYSVAIVTSETFNFFWLLAREQELSDEKKSSYLQKAQEWGFDISKLEFP